MHAASNICSLTLAHTHTPTTHTLPAHILLQGDGWGVFPPTPVDVVCEAQMGQQQHASLLKQKPLHKVAATLEQLSETN